MATALPKLLDAVDVTGAGSAYEWAGGRGNFATMAGTWNNAQVALQMSPDNGTTWFNVGTNTNLTADGTGNFELPECKIRANVTGANPTDLTAWVSRLVS